MPSRSPSSRRTGFSSLLRAVIAIAHRHGVSRLMMRARRRARNQNARLSFTRDAVHWRRGDTHVLLRQDHPYSLGYRLHLVERMIERAIPTETKDARVFDFREGGRYRLPSGRQVWLPTPIERADTCSGYLARGEPGPGDVVLDVGAFCGELTIELALRVGPSGRVFACEPNPIALQFLARNLALHGIDNVTVLPFALWETTTTLRFASTADAGACLSSFFDDVRQVSHIEVPALSPADVFARIGRVPDFIKMDIEGAELEVLAAMAPLLRETSRPVRLAIASYHLREGRETHELISPGLRAAGFTVETGYPEHTTTWAWKN